MSKHCHECNGRETITQWENQKCTDCYGSGNFVPRIKRLKTCGACKGTTEFKLRSGKIIQCRKCVGNNGRVERIYKGPGRRCRTCRGSGTLTVKVGSVPCAACMTECGVAPESLEAQASALTILATKIDSCTCKEPGCNNREFQSLQALNGHKAWHAKQRRAAEAVPTA